MNPSSINFFSEEIIFSPDHPDILKAWIINCAGQEEFSIQELNFIFTSDTYLHQVNIQYLDHDTYTDIITFDNSEEESSLEGDIFISIDRIKENSIEFNTSFFLELSRVMIHGVLHLMGHEDDTPEKKKLIRKKEDACLSLLNVPRGTDK